jgi:hypothetical protein
MIKFMKTKIMFFICTLSIQDVIIRVHDIIARGLLHRTVYRTLCAQYMNTAILKINYLCFKAQRMRLNRCVEIKL